MVFSQKYFPSLTEQIILRLNSYKYLDSVQWMLEGTSCGMRSEQRNKRYHTEIGFGVILFMGLNGFRIETKFSSES